MDYQKKMSLKNYLLTGLLVLAQNTQIQEVITAVQAHQIKDSDYVKVIVLILTIVDMQPDIKGQYPQSKVLMDVLRECLGKLKLAKKKSP